MNAHTNGTNPSIALNAVTTLPITFLLVVLLNTAEYITGSCNLEATHSEICRKVILEILKRNLARAASRLE